MLYQRTTAVHCRAGLDLSHAAPSQHCCGSVQCVQCVQCVQSVSVHPTAALKPVRQLKSELQSSTSVTKAVDRCTPGWYTARACCGGPIARCTDRGNGPAELGWVYNCTSTAAAVPDARTVSLWVTKMGVATTSAVAITICQILIRFLLNNGHKLVSFIRLIYLRSWGITFHYHHQARVRGKSTGVKIFIIK